MHYKILVEIRHRAECCGVFDVYTYNINKQRTIHSLDIVMYKVNVNERNMLHQLVVFAQLEKIC